MSNRPANVVVTRPGAAWPSRAAVCTLAVLTKLTNRAPIGFHKIARTTIQIGDLDLVHVDTQSLVKRGEDFLDVDRAIDWPAAARVGGADDLPRLQSTASD